MATSIHHGRIAVRWLFSTLTSLLISSSVFAQLSGTKTINPVGGDYADFKSAVAALVAQGVNGPVTFSAANGTYNEQVTIPEITGASAVNTITFQSQSGDSSKVVLVFNSVSSTSNFTLRLNGADYINLKKISIQAVGGTYGKAVDLKGSVSNFRIENCRLLGPNLSNESLEHALIYCLQQKTSNLTFQDNFFSGSNYGIYIEGLTPSDISVGTRVSGNIFTSQFYCGVSLQKQNAPVVSSNSILLKNNDGYGIWLQFCYNALEVQKNTISLPGGRTGIYLYYCTGEYLSRGRIVNNIVSITGGADAAGIHVYQSNFQEIWHNSVSISAETVSDYGAFLLSGGSDIDVRNNIFSNSGGNYAYNIKSPEALVFSDYNNYFSNGVNIAYWGSPVKDLGELTAMQNPVMDANSLSFNPVYTSDSDLHPQSSFIDNKGISIPQVTSDINDQPRSPSHPDIGAYEFTSAIQPLAGVTYTIGGASPSYTNFAGAVNDLNTRGISGPVVFKVRNGSYNEQLSFNEINGSSEVNTILFQSESGDSSKVELAFSANVDKKYLVRLSGTDHISFHGMTFSALNSSYSLVFYLTGFIKSLDLKNSIINGKGNDQESNAAAIYSGSARFTNLLIENCVFNKGGSGIWLGSPYSDHSKTTRIFNSVFNDQYYEAVYLKYFDSPRIEKNRINTLSSPEYYSGISMERCFDDLIIQNNTVITQTGGTGIRLYFCEGSFLKYGMTANNIIDIGGTQTAQGIEISYCQNQKIYFNSIRILSSIGYNSKAFNIGASSGTEVLNNIFANFGGGKSYCGINLTGSNISDYNNLFSTGNYLADWDNSSCIDISSYRTQSGTETHSVSVNPGFTSTLHTSSSFLNNKGLKIDDVTTDFDGESRSQSFPDIGADEFTPVMTPLSGTYTIGGSSPDYESFTQAATALNERGVSGPVVFNVRNGTYVEQFVLYEIAGASPARNIIFRAESGDSTAVVLAYSPKITGDFIIKLIGTDYLTLQNLTIALTNSNHKSYVLALYGNVSNLKIINNVLSINVHTESIGIWSQDGNILNSISVLNNHFIDGRNGIFLDGYSLEMSAGIEISGNHFNDQVVTAIELEYAINPVIRRNEISGKKFSYSYSNTGISLDFCNGKLDISENRIYLEKNTTSASNGSTGISLQYCDGDFVNQGIISNNFITIGGALYGTGISLGSCEYQNVLYNSVNISSSTTYVTSNFVFTLTGGVHNFVRNNIFSASNGGYAYYINSPDAIDGSDFNNYYSTTDLAYWGGTIATLPALRSANNMDAKSVSVDPQFASATDLRTKQTLLHKAATPSALVSKDIFGNPRDPVKPDIGAMEFFCTKPVFDLTTESSCFGDTTILHFNITGAAYGSYYSFDFDNDYNPDTSFISESGTIPYLFKEAGTKTVNLIANQIAGCNDFIAKTINIEPAPVLELSLTGAYCGEDNGSAEVNVTGSTGPFSYSWSDGSTASSITNLAKGTYSVTVRNINNCINTTSFEIDDRIVVSASELSEATCGQSDGSAVAVAEGGTEPYRFVWSNGETGVTADSLSTGINYVNVTDASGCSARGAVNISTDPSGPKIGLKLARHNICHGDKEGSLDVTITGGTKPYSILWSNGSADEDITNLPSGIYDLVVTDNTGCIASASYGITQPVFLNVSAVVEDASCQGGDGTAIALAGGGTRPYRYLWSDGSTGAVARDLSAGVYSLKITDNNNCVLESPVIVNSAGGPIVKTNLVKGIPCGGGETGSIDISVSGGTPLYSYFWLPGGQTSQDINGLAEGSYQVEVTDNAGCTGAGNFIIGKESPLPNPICLVTVDTLTGKNLLVWEKISQPGLAFYNIYRESSSKGIYQLIASTPAADPGEYIDSVADPSLRSWRYKISAVDLCGNESALSEAHKTIHLTQNVGLNGMVNLIWDNYEGFTVNTFRIYRYTESEAWKVLDNLPGDLTSFSDDSPLREQELFYEIEIENPNGSCTTLKAKSYRTSRSNRQSTQVRKTAGIGISDNLESLIIYPNPAVHEFTLELSKENLRKTEVEIIDTRGSILGNYSFSAGSDRFRTVIDLEDIPVGIYLLKIDCDGNVNYRKLVVQTE